MKWITLTLLFMFSGATAFPQQDDAEALYANAKKFMRQGDYANASLILVRAMEMEPENLKIVKDLALNYYMQNDNEKGLNVIRPFLSKRKGDAQAFQIAAMLNKRMGQVKEAEKIYKDALKIFPSSGPLYNDYGELLWQMHDYSAIDQWENGIKEDPGFPGNYYHATKYYYLSKDKVWSLLYGEIFVNIESNTSRTAEVKNILLEGYKKLFATTDLLEGYKGKNKFEMAFLDIMNQQNSIVVRGLNAETLTMIRTRYILDWYPKFAEKYPYLIFDLQHQLLIKGLFPAYNQWLFGAAQNLSAYQTWMNTHAEAYKEFTEYLKDRNFKLTPGEYYH